MSWRERHADLVLWTLAALVGAALTVWAFPRAFPLIASGWRLHAGEAAALAREGFRHLGEPVKDPYVVVFVDYDAVLERRLHQAAGSREGAGAFSASRLGQRLRVWSVPVYPPGAEPEDWAYLARISAGGAVLHLERRPDPGPEVGEIDPAAARVRADDLLHRLGYDPASFEEPTLRRREQPGYTEVVLRYRAGAGVGWGGGAPPCHRGVSRGHHTAVLGPELAYGVEVEFAGDRLACFRSWREHSGDEESVGELRLLQGAAQVKLWAPYLLFALVAVPFLRRYNEGTVEVGRGVRIFLLLLVCGVVLSILIARAGSGMTDYDISRRLTTWIWGFRILVLLFAPLALTTALSWSAGEVRCRERWAAKLAALDAVVRGRFATATVARAALRGPAAGVVLGAAILLLVLLLRRLGGEPLTLYLFGGLGAQSSWPGLASLLLFLLFTAFNVLFTQLFLLPVAVDRLGPWLGGAAVAVVSALVFFPPLLTLPLGSELLFAVPAAAATVGLFLAYDLLTALLASLTLNVGLVSLPYLFAEEAFLNLQGALPLAVLALPLMVSFRGLVRGNEAVYRWQAVPPHVRRIARRERERLELETARRIQGSILPELPARLHGVELAHAYRPATEVGGDFYEVTALADGRLALAVGDVAGHGVGSGLVMAMARSALAAQIAVDPAVEAVFFTLNRILHDTARRSLMATLCYGVLDPRRRELAFASAGHLFPYVVAAGGAVRWLESVAYYPLGVRRELPIRPAKVRLAAGDTLVLVSDGVVEAHPEGTGELFGFERLEECLRRHAGTSAGALRDGVLADLAHFSGPGPREDDQTILVARLP